MRPLGSLNITFCVAETTRQNESREHSEPRSFDIKLISLKKFMIPLMSPEEDQYSIFQNKNINKI